MEYVRRSRIDPTPRTSPPSSENTLQGAGTHRTSRRQTQALQTYRASMREDGAELRLIRRACSRLHLDQIRPHGLGLPPRRTRDTDRWWESREDSELGELFAPATEKCVGPDDECGCSQSDQGCEDHIKVAIGACVQNVEFNPEHAGRRLYISRLRFGKNWTGWIDQQGHDGRGRHQLMHQFQLFGPRITPKLVTPVSSVRSVQAGNKSHLDWIGPQVKDDWDSRGRRLGRKGPGVSL